MRDGCLLVIVLLSDKQPNSPGPSSPPGLRDQKNS